MSKGGIHKALAARRYNYHTVDMNIGYVKM